MSNSTISIFGNKIFLEIVNEIKLFSKFNIKHYEDLNLCVKDAEKQNLLAIFFVNQKVKSFFDNNSDIPIIKNVSIPCQFFNKLPVDIMGQKIIIKLIKPIFEEYKCLLL